MALTRQRLEPPPPGLIAMRRLATLMLVMMAAVFLTARHFEATALPGHAWIGFVRAFAEAAMVGGLADWFAVTALFRHPLGLPIPHTAIVPKNKDRIGDQLAQFLRDNFLIPHVVARRMQRMDVAGAAGAWLAAPTGGSAQLTRGMSRLAVEVLQALDQERLGGMVRGMMVQQVRTIELSPLAGRALGAAIADKRHLPVIDAGLKWARDAISSNDAVIRELVQDRVWRVVRWAKLDETIADKLIETLEKLLVEVADNPDHPLRKKLDEGLANLAWDLQYDDAMKARVEEAKLAMLENPAMQEWINGLWERARAGMLSLARDPERLLKGGFGQALRQLGETLQQDPRLRDTINRFVRRAVVGAAADYGDGIVRLVSETVRGWDTATITRRLENAVGRDLQYIRINGTLVGGMVGMAIHAVDVGLG